MENTYFSHNEAQQKIGQDVEALYDFPSVPIGSTGTVAKVKLFNDKNWIVCEVGYSKKVFNDFITVFRFFI